MVVLCQRLPICQALPTNHGFLATTFASEHPIHSLVHDNFVRVMFTNSTATQTVTIFAVAVVRRLPRFEPRLAADEALAVFTPEGFNLWLFRGTRTTRRIRPTENASAHGKEFIECLYKSQAPDSGGLTWLPKVIAERLNRSRLQSSAPKGRQWRPLPTGVA
jgi:hypothetical protein